MLIKLCRSRYGIAHGSISRSTVPIVSGCHEILYRTYLLVQPNSDIRIRLRHLLVAICSSCCRNGGQPCRVEVFVSQPPSGGFGPFLDPLKVALLPDTFGPGPIHRCVMGIGSRPSHLTYGSQSGSNDFLQIRSRLWVSLLYHRHGTVGNYRRVGTGTARVGRYIWVMRK